MYRSTLKSIHQALAAQDVAALRSHLRELRVEQIEPKEIDEVLQILERIGELVGPTDPDLVRVQAELADYAGKWYQAQADLELAVLESRARGDAHGVAMALVARSLSVMRSREMREVISCCREALEHCPAEDLSLRAKASFWLGTALIIRGDWLEGERLIQAGSSLARRSRDPVAQVWSAVTQALGAHLPKGELKSASKVLREALENCLRCLVGLILHVRMNLALILIMDGHEHFKEARSLIVAVTKESGRQGFVYQCLQGLLAMVAVEEGQGRQALQILKELWKQDIAPQIQPWLHATHLRACCLERRWEEAGLVKDRMRESLGSDEGLYRYSCDIAEAQYLALVGRTDLATTLLQTSLESLAHGHAPFFAKALGNTLRLLVASNGKAAPVVDSAKRPCYIQTFSTSLRLFCDDQEMHVSDSFRSCLAFLICAKGREVSSSQLALYLSSSQVDAKSRRGSLNGIISWAQRGLKHVLLLRRKGFSQLDLSIVHCDALEFLQLAEDGFQLMREGLIGEGCGLLQQAKELVVGPFLGDVVDAKVSKFRKELERTHAEVLKRLAGE
jgi:hypothetical protein